VPVAVDPVQLAAAHVVVAGYRRQARAPLQAPERPHVLGACAGQLPRGSCPSGTAAQVPTAPATLQAEQVSVQALPQQTPSTQNPVAHCCPWLHAAAAPRFAAQVPPSQK
jgi:hypothetical protein